MHVNVCSPGRKWDPGFQRFPKSSRVLTPIWAGPLHQNVTKNSRHGGWTGDANLQTGVDALLRQAVGGGGGSGKLRASRTHQLHLFYRTAATICRNSTYVCGKTRYLFCKTPFIYRILTPGSNPLQRRRRTGNQPRGVHYGGCRLVGSDI